MTKIIVVLFVILPSVLPAGNKCEEVSYMQKQFLQWVGETPLTDEYQKVVFLRVNAALNLDPVIKSPQYVLFVDRNPSVQLAVLIFVDPLDDRLTIIGADKVSTGNYARRGHFVTPLGFLENLPGNMSYRALGTKNSRGWRGLGVKGSRVWDFGWVKTHTTKGHPYLIRLLLHAIDPDSESRLGKVGSKGCIRTSAKLNRFLDYFGILDAQYEVDQKARRVLLSKREPVCFSGQFVLVGDSSEILSNTGAF